MTFALTKEVTMFGCSDDCRWMRHCEGMPKDVSADPISQPRFIGNRPSGEGPSGGRLSPRGGNQRWRLRNGA